MLYKIGYNGSDECCIVHTENRIRFSFFFFLAHIDRLCIELKQKQSKAKANPTEPHTTELNKRETTCNRKIETAVIKRSK